MLLLREYFLREISLWNKTTGFGRRGLKNGTHLSWSLRHQNKTREGTTRAQVVVSTKEEDDDDNNDNDEHDETEDGS